MAYVGLATPFRSSRLAVSEPATSEDWMQEDVTDGFRSLCISTVDHGISQPFPQIEDQDDEGVQTGLESQLAEDLEIGMLKAVPDGLPQPPTPRIRRRSMRLSCPIELDNNRSADEIAPKSTGLSPSSLLCQAFLPPSSEPPLKYKPFSGEKEAIYDPDFTFHVDLPHAYGVREDISFDQSWITVPGVIIGC